MIEIDYLFGLITSGENTWRIFVAIRGRIVWGAKVVLAGFTVPDRFMGPDQTIVVSVTRTATAIPRSTSHNRSVNVFIGWELFGKSNTISKTFKFGQILRGLCSIPYTQLVLFVQ